MAASAAVQAAPWLQPLCGNNALRLRPLAAAQEPLPRFAHVIRLHRSQRILGGDFSAHDARLPLANDCLALVDAAFVLETSPCAELLLAECGRLLLAEGHLALLTLNPYSPERLRGAWKRLRLESAAGWTAILQERGFEMVRHETLGARTRPAALRPVNFLLARKRKAALTPIRKGANAVAMARETTQT